MTNKETMLMRTHVVAIEPIASQLVNVIINRIAIMHHAGKNHLLVWIENQHNLTPNDRQIFGESTKNFESKRQFIDGTCIDSIAFSDRVIE